METVTIRVPATSANLAVGFDVLGIALGLYNTLTFTPAEELSFSGCDTAFQNEENLAYVAYARVWQELRRSEIPPVRIHIQADIPVCRGLGSSAALIAAGAMAPAHGNIRLNVDMHRRHVTAAKLPPHPLIGHIGQILRCLILLVTAGEAQPLRRGKR